MIVILGAEDLRPKFQMKSGDEIKQAIGTEQIGLNSFTESVQMVIFAAKSVTFQGKEGTKKLIEFPKIN